MSKQQLQKNIKGGSAFRTLVEVDECNFKKCTTAFENDDKSNARKKFTRGKGELQEALQKKKIDYEKYKEQINILSDELESSKEAQQLIACSIGKCSKETRKFIANATSEFSKACKEGDGKSCAKAKEAKEIKKKPQNNKSFSKVLRQYLLP